MRKVEVTGEVDVFGTGSGLFVAFFRRFWIGMARFVQKMRRTCDNLTGVHTHKIYRKNLMKNQMPKK
jgi:hypothetical protein